MLKARSLVVIVVLIAGGALVNGAATQRWSVFEPDPALTARLEALEVRFQDWAGEVVPTDMPTNERSTALTRRYGPPGGAQYAVITLISGVPGSVSTHTPDVCYPGSGYRTLWGPKKETLDLPDGTAATFYTADFEKRTSTRVDKVRARWAWATPAGGPWVAPDNPRWQFAAQLSRAPVLYKLYVVNPLPDDGEEHRDDDATIREFVRAAWSQYAAGFAR